MIREYIIKISDEIMEEAIAGRPQELVRCKECEYGAPHTNYRGEHGVLCHNVRGSTNGYVHDENWFCGDGKGCEAGCLTKSL